MERGGELYFWIQVTAFPYTFNCSNLKQLHLVGAAKEIQTF